MFSDIPGLYPLDAGSTPSYDNQKRLRTLPLVEKTELVSKQGPDHRGTHKPFQGTWTLFSREEGATEVTEAV